MVLDEKGRKKRAIKAGKASGKKRASATKKRDKNICLAHKYLCDKNLKESETLKAIAFITENGGSVNLRMNNDNGYTPNRVLADCLGVTRSRIGQILKKESKKCT